mmetsp:Transcript_107661/g.347494  ORF Transcript_107661/g.347494 Transcript_107661/m.347494 type:complete len:202 (+) Transcript_107661:260-865(+)
MVVSNHCLWQHIHPWCVSSDTPGQAIAVDDHILIIWSLCEVEPKNQIVLWLLVWHSRGCSCGWDCGCGCGSHLRCYSCPRACGLRVCNTGRSKIPLVIEAFPPLSKFCCLLLLPLRKGMLSVLPDRLTLLLLYHLCYLRRLLAICAVHCLDLYGGHGGLALVDDLNRRLIFRIHHGHVPGPSVRGPATLGANSTRVCCGRV